MHALTIHAPRLHMPTPGVVTRPARAALTVVEVAIWLTRDLSCGAHGHQPFAAGGTIQCHRCGRRVTHHGKRGRIRWIA